MNYFVSSIGFFHTLDLRDSPVVPSRGFVFNQTFELAASAIGSEIEYFRTTARASYFIPFGKTLLELGARAGVIRPLTETPAISRQFQLTNVSSTAAAPQCEVSANAISVRMIAMVIRSAASSTPFSTWNIPFHFMANCWAPFLSMPAICFPTPTIPALSDMRYGIGAGLRYKLPIGPIRLDYGVNPDPREHEDFGAFHFSFGFAF